MCVCDKVQQQKSPVYFSRVEAHSVLEDISWPFKQHKATTRTTGDRDADKTYDVGVKFYIRPRRIRIFVFASRHCSVMNFSKTKRDIPRRFSVYWLRSIYKSNFDDGFEVFDEHLLFQLQFWMKRQVWLTKEHKIGLISHVIVVPVCSLIPERVADKRTFFILRVTVTNITFSGRIIVFNEGIVTELSEP